MQTNITARRSPHRSYWIGILVGNLPFFLILALFIAVPNQIVPFDQSIRWVLYLCGIEALVTLACVLIKRLRSLGAGLFTSLFFTPFALLALGCIITWVSGPVF